MEAWKARNRFLMVSFLIIIIITLNKHYYRPKFFSEDENRFHVLLNNSLSFLHTT
jgi:hypothetical protein